MSTGVRELVAGVLATHLQDHCTLDRSTDWWEFLGTLTNHILDLVRIGNVAAISSHICAVISQSLKCLLRFWLFRARP